MTKRRRLDRAQRARWQALVNACGARKMSQGELGELRRLTIAVGGRRALRALGLRELG